MTINALTGFKSVYPALETNVVKVSGPKRQSIELALNGVTQGDVPASAVISLQKDAAVDIMVRTKHSKDPKEFRLEYVGDGDQMVLKAQDDINAFQHIADGSSVMIGSSVTDIHPSFLSYVGEKFPRLAFAVTRNGNTLKIDSMHASAHLVYWETHLKDLVKEVIKFNARKLMNVVNVFGKDEWREYPKVALVKHEDFGYKPAAANITHAIFNLSGEVIDTHSGKPVVRDDSYCVDLLQPLDGENRYQGTVDFKPSEYGYIPSDKRYIIKESFIAAQRLAGIA
jgi:hypothetical protein